MKINLSTFSNKKKTELFVDSVKNSNCSLLCESESYNVYFSDDYVFFANKESQKIENIFFFEEYVLLLMVLERGFGTPVE